MVFQRPSWIKSAPKYSFGKPQHGRGWYHVPTDTFNSRSTFMQSGSGTSNETPGPGQYDTGSYKSQAGIRSASQTVFGTATRGCRLFPATGSGTCMHTADVAGIGS